MVQCEFDISAKRVRVLRRVLYSARKKCMRLEGRALKY